MRTFGIFSIDFVQKLKTIIDEHHQLYPTFPPIGIYFEYLVMQAFRRSGVPDVRLVATRPNSPREDLQVGPTKLSIKTESGKRPNRQKIRITKLLTTEKEPWTAESLVERTLEHLGHYGYMLMLRAIPAVPQQLHYQLVVVPIDVLQNVQYAKFNVVGNRAGRQSLGGDVFVGNELVFHVHYDASDGKCVVSGLSIDKCLVLDEWDYLIPPTFGSLALEGLPED